MAIRKSSTSGVPFGNTANRPANPQVGQTYYNGELGYQEIYTSAGWISAAGGNDFNLNITGTYTTVTFSQSYASGSYSILSSGNDATIDIYAYAADGSLAGYTATKAFSATQRFNKMVIIGGTSGDVLGFSYKTTFATSSTTSETTAGPFITAISPSAMPNINDTVTITGGNFASDVQVAFTAAGYSSTPAKNIVRSSASSLIVTRPDNFPISSSPYTVTVTNPGVSSPVGTSAHISSNSITAGTTPVWNTAATLPTFTRNSAYSTVLSATDPDTGGSITYSLVSGSLPTGLSLSSLTGGISGTPTDGIAQTFTIRATDAGGNYVDRAFTIPNAGPVWSTGTTLPTFTRNVAYSTTVVATDDSGNNPTYSLVSGSLPTGLSLSSGGVISGTPTSALAATFTIRATDVNGNTADRAFTMPNAAPVWVTAATLPSYVPSVSTTYTLNATDDSGVAPTYSLFSGSLPTGMTLSGNIISGTAPTSGTFNFTIRATDANGNTADRAFTAASATLNTVSFTSVGTTSWTFPSNAASSLITYLVVAGGGSGGDGNLAGGGGGAGGMIEGTSTFSPGTTYTIAVGAGGSGISGGNNARGNSGGNSQFGSIIAYGGAGGAGCDGSAINGGSGGGGAGPCGPYSASSATIGTGIPSGGTGYGNGGANWTSGSSYGYGGGGGGAGGSGSGGVGNGNVANSGGAGRTSSITGTSETYCTGGGGASNFYSGANATNYGGGGGGAGDATTGSGRQGIVVVRYYT